ncbi:hypothetical protein AYI70_g12089 [Smittium culicis]|uniref:Uncharacterized protein n=1 Tax=Smittium culicis TaxID=133412 RepID=A0A1R1WYY9_9FUNG|nr:hypothetical protein AYI70_g12089 [Smittium culicis]
MLLLSHNRDKCGCISNPGHSARIAARCFLIYGNDHARYVAAISAYIVDVLALVVSDVSDRVGQERVKCVTWRTAVVGICPARHFRGFSVATHVAVDEPSAGIACESGFDVAQEQVGGDGVVFALGRAVNVTISSKI